MLIVVPDVLTRDELAWCRQELAGAGLADGRATAGDLAARVKNNRQLPAESPVARRLGAAVLAALGRCALYHAAALPFRVLPPTFSRYDAGMEFGAHVDNAIRFMPDGEGAPLRADVSTTLMLSDPQDYAGGDLVIDDTYGSHRVQLAAGAMVVYPSSSLHRVEPVTGGVRWAAVLWAQSMVRDDGERTQLYELDRAIRAVRAGLGDDHAAVTPLVSHYHNLLRRWAEL
ncbi:Fe2+-dependent dioxygenase [Pseudoxanthobacter sp.]|uniref:Fe2+-dependent dioxygenase n=1 Tax=Pseudoxanthobacter sp. TaxID=1925742 RepID=UPI002FE034B7